MIQQLNVDMRDGQMVKSMATSLARAAVIFAAAKFPDAFTDIDTRELVATLSYLVGGLIYVGWSLLDKRSLRDAMPRPENMVEKGGA